MKLFRRLIVMFAILGIAIVAGCATGRSADLRDCGKLSVGVGLGLGADVEIGMLSHPALGLMSITRRVGFEDRTVAGVWTASESYSPAINIIMPIALDRSDYPLSSTLNHSYMRGAKFKGQDRLGRVRGYWINTSGEDRERSAFNRASNIEVGASLLIVSARVGINPLEIVDYILGFVGIDIAKDDPKREDKEKPTTESTPTK